MNLLKKLQIVLLIPFEIVLVFYALLLFTMHKKLQD